MVLSINRVVRSCWIEKERGKNKIKKFERLMDLEENDVREIRVSIEWCGKNGFLINN